MAKDIKCWCLFIDGIPEVSCLSFTRAKVMRMAEKAYQSHWSLLEKEGYSIRMAWVTERSKGERYAHS